MGGGIGVVGHDAYVAGGTNSPNFPVSRSAFQPAGAGANDAFVSRLATDRAGPAGLRYSTYLGGSGGDVGLAIAVNGHDAFVTGITGSPDFPVTAHAFQSALAGTSDAFVARLDTG